MYYFSIKSIKNLYPYFRVFGNSVADGNSSTIVSMKIWSGVSIYLQLKIRLWTLIYTYIHSSDKCWETNMPFNHTFMDT